MTVLGIQTKPTGWIIAAATAAIFFVDWFTPAGYSVLILYLFPILLTWFVPGGRSTLLTLGSSFILAWLGMVVSHDEVTSTVVFRHTEASLVWLVIAMLIMKQKQVARLRDENQAALRDLNATLEQRVKERASALLEANERWDWVTRATQDGVWDWDLVHDTVYFSPRWKEMHGFQESDPLESEKEWLARIHPEDRNRVRDRLEEYFAGKRGEFWEEYRIQRKDGVFMGVLDRGVAIFDEKGRAVRMVGAETDITWRKEAEEALNRRAREFHLLADNVPALFAYVDREQRYRFVNKRWGEFFSRSVEETIGLTMFEMYGPDGYKVVSPYVNRALIGALVSFEYERSVPGDGIRSLSVQYVPDWDGHDHVSGFYALMVDITELKRSHRLLKDQETQLRDLTARLLSAQEDERRRIARDLHDDVNQRLAALSIELGSLRPAQTEPVDLSLQLKGLGSSVEQLTMDLQRMAHQLHPSILEHAGLEVALREQVDEFSARLGLTAEVMMRDIPKNVPIDQATCLYRVLQECLRNIQKHANATNVLVRLVKTGKGIGLCVHDDGRGFDHQDSATRQKGLGLTSMIERVAALKGTFRIKTKPGHGTEVHVVVPAEVVTSGE